MSVCPPRLIAPSTPSAPASIVPPAPPRYWWLKRIFVASILLVLTMALVRVWWGFEAERRLNREIANYLAAGEPVRLADLASDAPLPEQNAAYWLMNAANAIAGGVVSVDDAYGHIQIWRDAPDGIQSLVAANATALALVRRARTCEHAHWNLPIGHNAAAAAQIWTVMAAQRRLSRLLDISAATAFQHGRHGEAVETLHDLNFQAKMIRRHPSLTSQLVANGIERILCTRVERFGRSLFEKQASASELESESERKTVLERIRALQEELLDERQWREDTLRSGFAERAGLIEAPIPAAATGAYGPLDSLLRPLHSLERTHQIRRATLIAQATVCGTWQEAERRLSDSAIDGDKGTMRTWLSLPTMDQPRGRLTAVFSTLAHRRLTAAAIALLRFHAERGIWPDALEELEPEFLDRVPADPFCASGGALSYLVGQPEPRLYSKGLNGVDDGGVDIRPTRSRNETPDGDIVFNLDGRSYRGNTRSRFVPPPLAQAVHNAEDERDAQTQSAEHRDETKQP